MSGINYERFEKISKDFEEEMKRDKIQVRKEIKSSYDRRKTERIEQWEAEQGRKGKDVEKQRQELQTETCNCTSRDSHTEKQCKSLDKINFEKMPIYEQNRCKMAAIEKSKAKGGKLFREQKYAEALRVYEWANLVKNGLYGMTDEECEKVCDIEEKLYLNIAACYLKLEEWSSCIEHCEMALDANESTKGYYRMAEAYIGKGDFEKALEMNEVARKRQPDFELPKKQHNRILELKQAQKVKAERDERIFRKKFRHNLQKLGSKTKKNEVGSVRGERTSG